MAKSLDIVGIKARLSSSATLSRSAGRLRSRTARRSSWSEARRGVAYTPGAFEVNIDVFRLFQEDKIEQAKDMITDALERFEDRGALTYNLACAEARLGETESAVEHLRAALELRPGLTDLARGDTDLDALREDPRFVELVPAASG
jgi:tetratricopeptide (TPR) repeat protein